ncbi:MULTISPECIES: CvfB family protein [Mesonia]|uniref:Conserved virulence factor B n=1 Tax=Mesonia oceanica TaxID=2687242 RepID=A0AC61Y6T8_9FLAO|nr:MULTISPECIES: S1-like domain-containing RNA-binding protein [Mesonia]MAN28299.1 GntR family transcriptional regulator [Mesonia sp.]MAQ39753.1 GntR family transcriptional regulator [Mesonia sp.]VVU99877.1 Conserved virulence factor B [Mesonia oceanica]|tara:strand:+ start:5845 stop:6684 length:840 start_codon:yes stop_codon:yes gene_type:complete
MLSIGEYHTLTIDRDTPPGLFLKDDSGEKENEVLLPNKYKPESFEIGDELEVFVYLDHDERPVATTLQPYVQLDEFAFLECVDVTKMGAFLDWGLEKHLFVPFKEQAYPMKKGEHYLIFCYLDEETQRLVASSKVNHFLDNSDVTVEPFEKVDVIVTNKTDIGFNLIVNELHQGLVYHDDVFQDLKTGDQLEGWVKKIRKDNKIDVTLQRPGYRSIEPNADAIYNELQLQDGFLPLTDKSTPEEIKNWLEMSKKSFKRAVGTLYKKRVISIEEDGIRLI